MSIIQPTRYQVKDMLAEAPPGPSPMVSWLGQAGFVIRYSDLCLVIDPYLSDALAKKYRGRLFAHERMMAPPVAAEELYPLDAVLCTHAHSDHMDPQALPVLARQNPSARIVVPRAVASTAADRGARKHQIEGVIAGQAATFSPMLKLHVLASAHEQLTTDGCGHHLYLGYVLKHPQITVYHGGDGVPYPALSDQLAELNVDVAILPVNGRDEHRRSHGVPGNFTFDEAVKLCAQAEIPAMIPCHFGMFAFNTIDEVHLDRLIAAVSPSLQVVKPIPAAVYQLCRLADLQK